MPLIVAAGSALDADPYELAEAAAAAGFDGFGLRLSDHHHLSDPADFRRHAAGVGLALHDAEVIRVGSPADPAPLLEQAAAAGARSVLVVSDAVDRRTTIDAVADVVEMAQPLGIVVGLEYMAWTDPSTPAEAVAVGRVTGCVVVVDVLHHVRVGAGRGELEMVLASGSFGWLQLCDAVRTAPPEGGLASEARHHRLPPGHGSLPLADLLAAFGPTAGRAALEHVVSVEVQSDELTAELALGDRLRLLHDAARSVLAAGAPAVGHDQAPSSTG